MINEKLSFKDFTHQTFLMDDPAAWVGVIKGTCFAQEGSWHDVFPVGMTGVTFERCNLDNCIIPEGNTIIDCSNRHILLQNDMEDWICDRVGNPIEPVNKRFYLMQGIDPDPRWIPQERLARSILMLAEGVDSGN